MKNFSKVIGGVPERFVAQDFFGNERFGFRIPVTDKRREISSVAIEYSNGVLSEKDYFLKMMKLGPVMVESEEVFSDKHFGYNCRNYAFEKVGLDHYAEPFIDEGLRDLHFRDLDDLVLADEVVKDTVVVYGDGENVRHWGVVDKVFSNDIRVLSKLGYHGAFLHKLHHVPEDYGNFVRFFNKR